MTIISTTLALTKVSKPTLKKILNGIGKAQKPKRFFFSQFLFRLARQGTGFLLFIHQK